MMDIWRAGAEERNGQWVPTVRKDSTLYVADIDVAIEADLAEKTHRTVFLDRFNAEISAVTIAETRNLRDNFDEFNGGAANVLLI